MKRALFITLAACAFAAAPATAQSFTSTFESVPGGPGNNSYTTVATADGWTGGANGIELQNHVAGNPAADGGNVFVELDTNANSSMFRTLDAGTYSLSFLYSPRPGIPASSNGIDVFLDRTLLYTATGIGGGDTNWTTISLAPFVAAAGSVLTFQASGTSDSLGGYVDNITLTAVPEPATWGMMILGFGLAGAALRRRPARRHAFAA